MFLEKYNEWLEKVDDSEREELLSIRNDNKEIKERFMLDLAFGTAGMRGTIKLGTFNMNKYTVMRATQGLSEYINTLGDECKKRGVVISYDTRRYSFEFALTAAKVLAKNEIQVYLYNDVRPVPMCSFAVRELKAIAGIMITASHNPKEYNGYKVYGEDGAQLDLDATKKVVEYINSIKDYFSINMVDIDIKSKEQIKGKDNEDIHKYIKILGETIDNKFLDNVKKQILSKEAITIAKNSLKIVYTPIHGSGAMPVTKMLDFMGINYLTVKEQMIPDTEFSTVSTPNPEQADALEMGISLAKKNGADIVVGTDPDCDRMGIAIKDDKGEYILLNGNQIGALMLNYELTRRAELGVLPDNAAIVKTIVTSKIADKIAQKHKATVFDVLTGFKFIGEKIKEWEKSNAHTYVFGFEESYGYLAGTHARDKDAVVAVTVFADMACYYKSKGKSMHEVLEELSLEFGYYIEKSLSLTFKGLDGMEKMDYIMQQLKKNRLESINNIPLESVEDFGDGEKFYSTGAIENIDLPRSNVIKYNFNDFEWACVRPSGTEPKLKIYVSVCADTAKEAVKKANNIIEALKSIIESY